MVRAPADGSTLMFTSSSIAILPALKPKLGFDPERELTPISVVCDLPPVLLVPEFPLHKLAQSPRRSAFKAGTPELRIRWRRSANHLAAASVRQHGRPRHRPYPLRGHRADPQRPLWRSDRLHLRAHPRRARPRARGPAARARRRNAGARASSSPPPSPPSFAPSSMRAASATSTSTR